MNTPRHAPDAPATHVMGVLALELSPGATPGRAALSQGDAGTLASLLGRDLGAMVEGVRDLDLVLAAAHFDPAEVLRPGWPLHRRLDEVRIRAPQAGMGPRILALGADAAGHVPLPLQADGDLAGGALRVVPWLLAGEPAAAAAVGARLEALLLDLGMARADTALHAQQAFGAKVEHARYLTAHDLAAMMSLQYRNQGLDALWHVVETVLLVPEGEAEVDLPHEPLLRYAGGEARIALLSPDAWRARSASGVACDTDAQRERLVRGYALYEARQRQYADVLRVHGIDVVFEHAGT